MFDSVLVANRGEIAVRIGRTCRELGVRFVAVHSDVDRRARHVDMADEAIHLPGVASADTYLNIPLLLDAARDARADAVHPGYGFLSENAEFAEAVAEAGLTWVGPPSGVTRAVGDKIEARKIARSAGVPVVPGLLHPVVERDEVLAFAAEHGYPIAIKAAGGGGGRGLKVARSTDEVADAFESARREAAAYFGSSTVYIERYLEAPKHMEVQILAPNPDEALWLGVRDCSLQRRHQKLIEETPPPAWASRVADMGGAATALSKACGYVNAGTVEFLVDGEGAFYFLEVNARLQVEHTVTEEVFGVDLVACQLKIAAGEPLGFSQPDLESRGHSIECRINAEDATRGFIPAPGVITRYVEPDGPGVRVDSGYRQGDEVPGAYDSLIAKVVVRGADRMETRRRMLRALREMEIEGVETTIPAHLVLLDDEAFVSGQHTTTTVEESGILESLTVAEAGTPSDRVLMVGGRAARLWNPAMSSAATAAVQGGPGGDLVAPMQGTILQVLVTEGQKVEAGAALIVLEAMKMETTIAAPRAGLVSELHVTPGDTAAAGQVLAVVT